jgi:hypothetical protein
MRPMETEYPPYYKQYIDQVEGDDIIWVLENQVIEFHEFLNCIPDERLTFSYAEGKWTIAEVLGHIIDCERVFAFRAFCFGRNDSNHLPGFEQDDYIKSSNFNSRTLRSFLDEFNHLRKSNNILFGNFGEEALHRKGIANNKLVTVNALLFIMAGHLNHHLAVLKERYGIVVNQSA